MHKCPKCGTEFEGKFCPECGEKYAEEKTCPQCGATLSGGVKFCNECGYAFYQKSAPAAPVPQAPAEQAAKPVKQTNAPAVILKVLGVLPELLLALYGLLSFLFLIGPVMRATSNILGELTVGNGYGVFSNTEIPVIRNCAITLLVFAILSLCAAAGLFLLKKKTGSALPSLIASGALYLVFLIVSSVMISNVKTLDEGVGLLKAGACPVCFLVFSILFLLFTAGGFVAEKLLKKKYPEPNRARSAGSQKVNGIGNWLKAHKVLISILSAVLIVGIILGVSIPVGLANRHNGTYYLYDGNTETYDETQFFKLKGNTWTSGDGTNGKIAFKGENVTLTLHASDNMGIVGSSAMEAKGLLKNGVLKIEGVAFAKKGHKHKMTDRECICGLKDISSEGLEFKKEGNHFVVTGIGTCTDTDIVIFKWHENKLVTEIGYGAFYGCSELTSIKIPDGVTSIGISAFSYCRRLTDIQFKGTVQEWQGISKGSYWNWNTGNYTVTCTDGKIAKNGMVTYF